MLTALDADPAQLDKHEQNFVERIREHGWFAMHVAPDDEGPGFAYTTGFWPKFKFPELIVSGLRRDIAHHTFWHIYRELDAGRRFPTGEPTEDIFQTVAARFFLCRRSNIDRTSAGAVGFMATTISSAFNWCIRIVAGISRGHLEHRRISERFNRI
jgi:Domain of unknown function (DUF4262)